MTSQYKVQENLSTFGGCLALILWSFSALFFCQLKRIPTLEITAVTMGFGFATSLLRIYLYNSWTSIRLPLSVWLPGGLLFAVNQFFYILAFKHAPPAHVELINFTWPILVVILSAFFTKEKFHLFQGIGVVLSFIGIYVLLAGSNRVSDFHPTNIFGYILASMCALIWATFTVYSRNQKKVSSEVICLYFGFTFFSAFLGHTYLEPTVVPSLSEFILLLFLGSVIISFSFFLWDSGLKKGNFKLLNVLSYTTPVLSVVVLVMFGKAALTFSLVLACLFVFSGSVFHHFIKWLSTLQANKIAD